MNSPEMPNHDSPSRLSNMQGWAESAIRLSSTVPGMNSMINEMLVTKSDVSEEFESLNLPSYARHIRPLNTFLADGLVKTAEMKTPNVWFQLIPRGQTARKFTVLDMPPESVSSSVSDLIRDNQLDPSDYDILVSEYLNNKYGGQMVVGKDGSISLFFGDGNEQDYSTGSKTPAYSATAGFTGAMHYSFEDAELRAITQKLVAATELDDPDGRFGKGHHPGYYEFAIGETPEGTLRPIFLDYRSADFYQLPSE